MKVLFIIPARLNSTRLANKMLLKLDNHVTILQSTYQQVQKSKYYINNNILIATDSEKIKSHCQTFTNQICKTSPACTSGTQRIAEAFSKLDILEQNIYDFVVNIQGDEPFLNPMHIDTVIKDFYEKREIADIATAAVKLPGSPTSDPSKVKVVVNQKSCAMYFSRSQIPYGESAPYWLRHIGMYVFKPKSLQLFAVSNRTYLETIENLEQLRFLELGLDVLVTEVGSGSEDDAGIDTENDYLRAKDIFRKRQQSSQNSVNIL